jgi:hypothetical protein
MKTRNRARYSGGNCNARRCVEPGERQSRREENAMKPPAFLLLFLSSVTISSAGAGTEASGDHGRSPYNSSAENVVDLQPEKDARADGGRPIQVVVKKVGTFQGWQGDALAVKVPGTAGNTRYDLAPEPDFLQFVQPSAPTKSNQ